MADTENGENATQKEQKEEENERIKTENKQSETNDQEGSETAEDKKETNPVEVKTEVEEKSEETQQTTDASNNSVKPEQTPTENQPDSDKDKTDNDKDKTDSSKNHTTSEKKDKSEPASEKPPKGVKVDLKAVQTHYRTHTKTTLPHILSEYGFEDKNLPKRYKPEKVKKKKKKVEIVESSDDDDRQSRKAREEKFRQMFGDNRNVDKYYMEYLDFIQEKVMKQRLQAQKQKEEEERMAKIREEEELNEEWELKTKAVQRPQSGESSVQEQKRRHSVTKRLHRIELKHDDSFLRDLPKTDLARIVKLQDRMKKDGRLKTQADVDKFWTDIRDPDTFYAQFKVQKTGDPGPSLTGEAVSNYHLDMPPRSLSHISESSRGEREPWAITQKYQSVNGQKTPTGEKPRKDSAQLAKEAALDLERRCPKLEMPPLACFSLKLGEKPPDPAEVQKKIELKAREKSRKKFQRKLQKMYQMAMTNTAASNRILAQHGDLTAITEGGTLRDVLAVFDEPFDLQQHYREMMEQGRQDEQLYEIASDASRSSHGSRHSSAGSRVRLTPISQTSSGPGSKSNRKKKSLEMIEAPPEPVPLSFNQVIDREKTVEAKCLSSYWSNYMHAGKSVFAPT